MLLETGPTALTVEVVLVPQCMFDGGRRRARRARDVEHVVTTTRHESTYPLGPKGGHDARRAPTPVETAHHRAIQIERVHEREQIVRQRGLLSRAWRLVGEERRRTVAA